MNKQQGWHALNANLDTEVGNKTVFGAYVQPNGVGIMIINDPMNDRLQFAVFNTDDLDGLSSEECNQKLSDDSYITKVAKKYLKHILYLIKIFLLRYKLHMI